MRASVRVFGGAMAALLTLVVVAAGFAAPPQAEWPVAEFSVRRTTVPGQSVFLTGNVPELSSNDVGDSLKLSADEYPDWKLRMELPPGTQLEYRYLLRSDSNTQIGLDTNLIQDLSGTPQTMTMPGTPLEPRTGTIRYLTAKDAPTLQVAQPGGGYVDFAFARVGEGRTPTESLWSASPTGLPPRGNWDFRIRFGDGTFDTMPGNQNYRTNIASFHMQDGEIFNYVPAATVSAPRVIKVLSFPAFAGLAARAIYIYLPRGYDQHTSKSYPVLYMHDGQNCFQAYVQDSFAGSWRADEVATALIRAGRIRECIIVGVSNGGGERLAEYLPDYSTYRETRRNGERIEVVGRASATVAYYTDHLAPYMATNYRVLTDRDNTATCGSSMGGLLSTYMAWEYPDFARQHAAVSPAYWVTQGEGGGLETVERLRTGSHRDIRLWLDSGTQSSPGTGTDGMWDTFQARDALLENGYVLGRDFWHYLHFGATHSEGSWASRMDRILLFLFPSTQEPELAFAGGVTAWVAS